MRGEQTLQSRYQNDIISRDIEFNEEDYYRWSNEDKNIKGMIFKRIVITHEKWEE